MVPNPRVISDLNLSAGEGEEGVTKELEKIDVDVGSHADCQVEGTSDGDSFVDIMGNLERDTGFESEGLTFADMLQLAGLLAVFLLQGVVDAPDMPSC